MTLEEIRPLIRIMVRERLGSQPWLIDDAEQEAMIRAWTRLEEGHPKAIAIHAARQAIIDVARGRRATGSAEAGKVDTHRHSTSIFRQDSEGEGYVFEPIIDEAQIALEQVELWQVLKRPLMALTNRDRYIVMATYWGLSTREELAEEFGITPQGISYRLKQAYKAMRRELE